MPSAWYTISSDSSFLRMPNRIGTPSATGRPSHHAVTGVSAVLMASSAPKWASSASTTLPATSSGVTMVRMSLVRAQVLRSSAGQCGRR